MTEPKTMHVWMIDGRSLCDRRAHPAPVVDQTDEEREAIRAESAAAPACGACLLVAGRIRREAATILKRHPVVEPQRASQAWRTLEGTRWAGYFDLRKVESSAERLDANDYYGPLSGKADPAYISELSRQWDYLVARGADENDLGFKGPVTR